MQNSFWYDCYRVFRDGKYRACYDRVDHDAAINRGYPVRGWLVQIDDMADKFGGEYPGPNFECTTVGATIRGLPLGPVL